MNSPDSRAFLMQETWRWFGPDDTVGLEQIKQAGATGVVTALDHIPTGAVWPLADIQERQALLAEHGLEWSVVESVPVHNDIKTRTNDCETLIANYKESLRNLGAAGIRRVCYNFMPVVDWTRTNLNYEVSSSAQALRFEMTDFVAYDVHGLKRPGAEDDYPPELLAKASARYAEMSAEERELLELNIIAGLPGGEGSYDRDGISAAINEFRALGTERYRENLFAFLRDIMPAAEAAGVVMCIHPDDPPFSLFGLPRVVSTAEDAQALLDAAPSPSNGLTMCAGSYGARSDNDLVAMVKTFGRHIHFVHLRNIRREADGSFYESEHLDGDNDIVGLVGALLDEEQLRGSEGSSRHELSSIPMRPDHGHTMGDEIDDPAVRPGYSYAGRMKGLAELRGVIHTLTTLRDS